MEQYQKIFSIVVIVGVIGAGALVYWTHGSQNSKSIYVFSGAGLSKPMDKIGSLFENEYGIEVKYNYAGSNTLLSQIELNETGNVYMPGATFYIEKAENKGFIGEKRNVAYHTPVIAVPKGNPKGITGLMDLTKPGVEVILGDPEAAACGKIANAVLRKNGILEEVDKNVTSRTDTANKLALYTAEGQADATICWKADLYGLEDKTEVKMIPEENNIIKVIPIGTLTFSEKKDSAREFVEFVGEGGRSIFEEYGFIKYE